MAAGWGSAAAAQQRAQRRRRPRPRCAADAGGASGTWRRAGRRSCGLLGGLELLRLAAEFAAAAAHGRVVVPVVVALHFGLEVAVLVLPQPRLGGHDHIQVRGALTAGASERGRLQGTARDAHALALLVVDADGAGLRVIDVVRGATLAIGDEQVAMAWQCDAPCGAA